MTVVDNLARWLGDQLDADKRIVREAATSPEMATGIPRSYVAAPMALLITEFANPTRVLREIDTKRQIVRCHYRRPAPKWNGDGIEGFECATCDQQFPCKTLRLLAVPYAARPGYKESWRP